MQHAGHQQPGCGRDDVWARCWRSCASWGRWIASSQLRRMAVAACWQGDLGELCGRTVGPVGFGAVPRILAPILSAMGAEVVYTGRGAKSDVPYTYLSKEDCWGKPTSSHCTFLRQKRPTIGWILMPWRQ
ncbi:MAG: hypothetical protein CM1200mP20_10440 [Pseudomonadota bacterium]|nr:MAG: hypothetical protein CM1200mP20_10440 [Pseudomonadota bacterium]